MKVADLTKLSSPFPADVCPFSATYMSRPHNLNRSYLKLQHAEKLLARYYDTSHPTERLSTHNSPATSPRSRRVQERRVFFGGILNNRNDPCRREGRREEAATARAGETKSLHYFTVPKARESHSAASPLADSEKQWAACTPGQSSEPEFTELLLGPKPRKLAMQARPKTHRTLYKSTLAPQTDRLSTVRVKPLFASPSAESIRMNSPMTIMRCTPASLFLDHMIKEQAFRKYSRIEGRTARAKTTSISRSREDLRTCINIPSPLPFVDLQ